jgi:uncharacterized protein YndB with AHSA1/START domain
VFAPFLLTARPKVPSAVTIFGAKLGSDAWLQFRRADGGCLMSATAILTPKKVIGPKRQLEAQEGRRSLNRSIALRVEIGADRRRIFDALTVPEYIETWLSLPCRHSECRTIASQADHCYRLDHYAADKLELSITGSYRACRRGKVFFTWCKSDARLEPESVFESLVRIRLYGAFAKSTLCLSHTGIFSETEYRWHRELWNRSLAKLQSLFWTR